MSSTQNPAPFLRTQRKFPEELEELALEVDRAYIDIAQKINERTIGIYSTRRVVNGESWFLTSQQLNPLRQVFTFSTFAAINHGIAPSETQGFIRIYGAFTDGALWYPLPYVSSTVAEQVGISITSTQITFDVGGSAPTITNGRIVLEWLPAK